MLLGAFYRYAIILHNPLKSQNRHPLTHRCKGLFLLPKDRQIAETLAKHQKFRGNRLLSNRRACKNCQQGNRRLETKASHSAHLKPYNAVSKLAQGLKKSKDCGQQRGAKVFSG
jgi:hypothetical protein